MPPQFEIANDGHHPWKEGDEHESEDAIVIGGSGIGGPKGPAGPRTPTGGTQQNAEPNKTSDSAEKKVADGFERHGKTAGLQNAQAQSPMQKKAESRDLARIARESPQIAQTMAEGLKGQLLNIKSDIQKELAAATAVLERLAAQKFDKEALKAQQEKLQKHREKVKHLKRRLRMTTRRESLLQQVAGQLDKSKLEKELDKLLKHHGRLKSGWGRRHHLLGLGNTLDQSLPSTPDDLHNVLQTEVRPGGGPELDDALVATHPKRILAEVLARTLDGSKVEAGELHKKALRGDYGEALQAYASLANMAWESLQNDSLGEKKQ